MIQDQFMVGEFKFQIAEQDNGDVAVSEPEEGVFLIFSPCGYAKRGYAAHESGGRLGNLDLEGDQWVYYRQPNMSRYEYGTDKQQALIQAAMHEIHMYGPQKEAA